MWKTKIWKIRGTTEAAINSARAKMDAWLEQNRHRIQYEEIFVNNAYAVEYRKLRRIL